MYIVFKLKPAIDIDVRIHRNFNRQVECNNYLRLIVGEKMNWTEQIHTQCNN